LLVQAWKSYSQPKISVFGGFTPKIWGQIVVRLPNLRGTTPFEPLLVQIWRTVPTVALAKKQKKKKRKKTVPHTGYSPRPPTSPYRSQSLHAGWPPVCSSIYQVSLRSVQWFCRCVWSKIALSRYFGHWLIEQPVLLVCTTVQAVIPTLATH